MHQFQKEGPIKGILRVHEVHHCNSLFYTPTVSKHLQYALKYAVIRWNEFPLLQIFEDLLTNNETVCFARGFDG